MMYYTIIIHRILWVTYIVYLSILIYVRNFINLLTNFLRYSSSLFLSFSYLATRSKTPLWWDSKISYKTSNSWYRLCTFAVFTSLSLFLSFLSEVASILLLYLKQKFEMLKRMELIRSHNTFRDHTKFNILISSNTFIANFHY